MLHEDDFTGKGSVVDVEVEDGSAMVAALINGFLFFFRLMVNVALVPSSDPSSFDWLNEKEVLVFGGEEVDEEIVWSVFVAVVVVARTAGGESGGLRSGS